MNRKHFSLLNLCLILTLLLSSCEKKWNEPEFQVPEYSVANRNLRTIAAIKELHQLGTAPDSIIPPPNRDIYIHGYVVSSDEGGNFFKSIVIQDATGGIELRLDKTGLYNEYPVGQEVFVDCRGLLIGDYGNYPQLGVAYDGGVGRLHALLIPDHVHKNGLPNTKTMYEFLGNGYQNGKPIAISNAADMATNVGKLVMIPNCTFKYAKTIGAPLAYNDIDYTEHVVLVNGTTDTLVLRTSSYTKFRNSVTCLDEKFTLYGILSVYNSTYQFTLRTAADIVYEAPQELGTYTFDQNSLTSGGWRVDNTANATRWIYQEVSGDKYMFHQPVTTSDARCDDWLISPAITIDNRSSVNMYLNHKLDMGAGLQEYYKVYYQYTLFSTKSNKIGKTRFGQGCRRHHKYCRKNSKRFC